MLFVLLSSKVAMQLTQFLLHFCSSQNSPCSGRALHGLRGRLSVELFHTTTTALPGKGERKHYIIYEDAALENWKSEAHSIKGRMLCSSDSSSHSFLCLHEKCDYCILKMCAYSRGAVYLAGDVGKVTQLSFRQLLNVIKYHFSGTEDFITHLEQKTN